MYNDHFGLKRAPFRITPDTKLFYPGGNRGEILEALIYAVTSGEGIVKVVGEVGSGKTMLCRMLEERLVDKVDIVYLANPSLSPEDTLHAIALEMKLDVGPEANRLQVMHVLQERLLQKHAENRQVVVFVEEAQSMPIATLEEIRLLSNLETNRDKLLQIVLFGQPELDENLEQSEIRQLKERITHSFYLDAFTPEQMREYVNFRMRAVGYRGPDIFRGGAYRRMARASEGLTRRINILADKALLAAFAEDTFDVGKRHVKIAINDSQFVRGRRWGLPELSLVSGLILIAAAVSWTFIQRSDVFGERLQKLLPGDASREISQPLAQPPAQTPDSVGEMQAEASVPAPASPSAAVAEPPAEAVAAPDTGTDTDSGQVAQVITAPPVEAPPEAPAPASETTVQVDTTRQRESAPQPTVPVADGGGRLMLSDTLSRPPAAEPRQGSAQQQPEPAAEPAPAQFVAASTEPAKAPEPATASTTVAVGPGLGPLTAARLAATRDWLQSADDRHFSIQLLLTDFARRANLEKFLRERQAAGEVEDYFVFETRIRSNVWFGVLYKEYPSFGAARDALEELPEEFRYHEPFIRNVRDIATLG